MATFVIVDDSMVLRTVLRYMIERCGETVLAEGRDAEEAVALVIERKPDAISLASSLRGEGGIALLDAIRRASWNGKVFFVLNSEPSAEEEAAIQQSNVDGVLRKPFTLDQVSGEIQRVMEQA